ncbi:MAG: hypothetical protein ACREJO_02640 [Phycisphaerales bacterium]
MSVNAVTTILARLIGVVAIATLIPHWQDWFTGFCSEVVAYRANSGVKLGELIETFFHCVTLYDNWPYTLQFFVGVYLVCSGRLLARLLARGLYCTAACPKCGYDCSGLPPGSKCPECGTKTAPDAPPSPAT